jgi:outer membrane protein OmpA-like peptidoglycan-associated protein
VAPERLTARGYGPDRAAVSNETGPGREQNRRVEFILTP